MKNKYLKIFFVVGILLCSLFAVSVHASSISGTYGENLTWALDGEGVLTISGTGDMENCHYTTMPWHQMREEIKKLIVESGVTSISESAFEGCSELAEIELSNKITTIKKRAFRDCAKLKSITIPQTVTNIEKEAFYNCLSLENIYWNAVSVNDFYNGSYISNFNDDYIGVVNSSNYLHVFTNAGKNGTGVSVVFGNNVEEIPRHAFTKVDNIVSVHIGDKVKTIGEYAFAGCININSLVIGKNVEKIGKHSFDLCEKIESFILPDSLTEIERCAFQKTGVNEVTVPGNVKSIGNGVFRGCVDLERVTISEGIEFLPASMFAGCTSLVEIKIPEGVKSIGDDALYGCESIKNLTIPESVTSISYSSFAQCRSLETMYWNAVSVADVQYYDMPQYSFYRCGINKGIKLFISGNATRFPMQAFLGSKTTDIYYEGTRDEWKKLYGYSGIDPFRSTTIHCLEDGTIIEPKESSMIVLPSLISINGVKGESVVSIAVFENGSIIGLKNVDVDGNAVIHIEETGLNIEDAESVKVYLWKSIESMKPLCEAQSIQVNN